MFCPECGYDAGEANFCPECGTELAGLRATVKGPRTTGGQKRGKVRNGAREARARAVNEGVAQGPQRRDQSTFSPMVIWIIVAIAAATVVAIVLIFSLGTATTSTTSSSGGTPTVPLEADTKGSYEQLVQRANDLFDAGNPLVLSDDTQQRNLGAQYFAAAAKVYQAAWKKKAGNPAVGTDWAISLFYSGEIDGAIDQVNVVLKKSPDFAQAHFNKGIFLQMKAEIAKQDGDQATADTLYAQAKQEFEETVRLAPGSDEAKRAAEIAAGL